jgi:hypothetical protein
MAFEATRDGIERFAQELITGIQKDMVDRGKNASHNLINSIKPRFIVSLDGFTTEFEALEYWKEAGSGRKPGKVPKKFYQTIQQWMDAKGGMTHLSAFLIAQKIGREGSKDWREGKPNIFTTRIDQMEPQLQGHISDGMEIDITKPVLQALKEMERV